MAREGPCVRARWRMSPSFSSHAPAFEVSTPKCTGQRADLVQCDMNIGTVISSMSVLVTPPKTISRALEWP
jgi:hypothetical protein